ncbi:MAG TPA: hypothetical protein VL995_13420 [Cellvibrio sp.]|nr:hypothetical protein [Cellvibrio sp.]
MMAVRQSVNHPQKRLLVVAGVALILVIATIVWCGRVSVTSSSVVSSSVQNERPAAFVISSESPRPNPQAHITVSAQLDWTGSVEQRQVLNSWAQGRGQLSSSVQGDDYDTYDNMALQSLAENNHDVKAMTILGVRLRGAEGIRWLNLAAVYGSSYALVCASAISTAVSPSASEEVKRAGLIDALTYKTVAEIRGDFYSSRSANMDHFETQLGVRLTDEDKALAEKKARPLYDELEAQRIQLGLGKFDNSVPPAVEAYYRKFIF